MNNFSATNTAAGNADLTNIATNNYARDRSLDRNAKDMPAVPLRESHEKDVLDNFMSLPKQQQMQIQMLTEQ